jgi:hypothetical protein
LKVLVVIIIVVVFGRNPRHLGYNRSTPGGHRVSVVNAVHPDWQRAFVTVTPGDQG